MYTVGRLGSYITKGVYTVSAPFHPFGGAVDIIVVEQQDGSFKSSPWYVRFGKFQGVLKAKEKVVTISVDGVQADFHMYLDHKGEAYFLREVDCEKEGDSILSPSSSGEETDGQSSGDKRPMKSKNCNFDESKLVAQIDINNGKILTRTSSRRSRIMGLVFGRRSMKEDRIREEEDGPGVVRADSLERAEIAADLLEMKWSTNLASSRYKRNNAPQVSAPDNPGSEADKGSLINEGHREMHSPLHDDMVNSSDSPVLHEETGILDSGMSNNYWVGFPKLESSDEDSGVEMSCLHTRHIIDECGVVKADHDENAKGFILEITSPKPASAELDACPSKKLDGEQVSKENILLPGNGLSEKSSVDRLEAFSYSEMIENSRVALDDSGGKKNETLFVSCREGAEVHVDAKTLHEIAELISEVNVQDTMLLVANEPLDFPETLVDGNCSNFFSDSEIRGNKGTSSNSSTNCILSETYTRIVTVDELNSVKKVESCSIYTVSGFDNSVSEVHDREDTIDEGNMNRLQYSSNAVADSQEFRGDSFSIGATNVPPAEGSVEEQLLFGDLDDFNRGEVKCMESNSSSHVKKENPPSVASDCSEAEIESLNLKDEPHSSSDKFVQENMPNDVEDFRENSRIVSSGIDIPRNNKVAGEDFGRMAESLPNMWSPTYALVVDDLLRPLGHSLDANPGLSKLTPLGINSDADKDDQVSLAHPAVGDAQISEELKDGTSNPAVGTPSEGINAPNGSWRVWPFSLKKSSSMKSMPLSSNSTRSSDAENTLEGSKAMDGKKDGPKPKVRRKKVRVLTPTPEQLASLNLKEGKNTVTFTFSTSMLGPQQVDARIYLWKWDTRVVISDVDGTITKSDVLGQFMPLVGMDWSQTGVAHLFSSIKENGYQLLFLSARAISQAYHTRRFLFNLKQDGKALPDGPVVISPDGLFPSLFREVIRRAPHEFKIACLEDIKALFPADRNPFYAGFGNRDTDEFSYLKVGIPKGKIFIINPKGEVVVNRRVDSKSYTSLHTLVHDMFPPMSSSEQEDFNSWNYWRLPPPPIDF